ncbi:hypothetical protein RYX36_010818 [Vicia faba]
MKLLAIALVFVLASSCMANDKRNLVSQMFENHLCTEGGSHKLIDQNNRHGRKNFGKPGGANQFGINDDNDHHYIPRKDYGTHPGNE